MEKSLTRKLIKREKKKERTERKREINEVNEEERAKQRGWMKFREECVLSVQCCDHTECNRVSV